MTKDKDLMEPYWVPRKPKEIGDNEVPTITDLHNREFLRRYNEKEKEKKRGPPLPITNKKRGRKPRIK